ncbi:hypothetical protein [Streptococcus pluranimalium]|uniref:hypothetical protein n=1 Tax=Streptococcus pluranimalium TaxID=82348 RepID=UPI00313950F3
MQLIKKVLQVGYANIVQVLLGIVLGFIVPKFLSIQDFAEYKTYTLIAGYIGIFHLGFVDGLYVDYGGKNLIKLDKERLRSEFIFFTLLQVFISIIILIISSLSSYKIGILIALSILPYNLNMYLKRIYQSTDKLEWYSKCLVLYSIVNGLLCIVLSLVFKIDSAIPYCIAMILSNVIVLISEMKRMINFLGFGPIKFEINRYRELFHSGFIILLGNLAVNFFYGIDRWVVKIFFTDKEFSFYSFAVSMLNIVTTVLQAISISMFSYFAKNDYKKNLSSIRSLIICIGTLSSLIYFFLNFIVKIILPEYVGSLEIISISMAIFPFMLYINAVTINLYKINHNEKKYLFVMIVMLLLVSMLDMSVLVFNNYIIVAWSTLFCYILWYFYSRYEVKNLDKLEWNEIFYLIFMTVSYLKLSHDGTYFGGILYLIIWILMSVWFMWDYIKNIL